MHGSVHAWVQFDRDFPAATQFFPKATKANQSFSSSKNLRGKMIIFSPRGVKHYEVAYYFNAIDAVPREKRIIPANEPSARLITIVLLRPLAGSGHGRSSGSRRHPAWANKLGLSLAAAVA